MESIRETFVNTINELNQELSVMKEAYDQLDNENQRVFLNFEKNNQRKQSNDIIENTNRDLSEDIQRPQSIKTFNTSHIKHVKPNESYFISKV